MQLFAKVNSFQILLQMGSRPLLYLHSLKKCPTGKVSYSSMSLAEDALIDSWSRNNFTPGNGPVNVYICDDCGNYHFTSKGIMNARLKTEWDAGRIAKQRLAFGFEQKLRRR